MHSVISLDVLKTVIVNWFHYVSKEHHTVLNKVIKCSKFTEYYEKLTSGEELADTAALYILSLHVNKSISVLLKKGIWTTTNMSSIRDNDIKFVFFRDGVFITIENKYLPMRIHKFVKQNTYDRKLKAMEKVNIQNHTPVRTRKCTLENCHGTRSLCKKVGNKWEFKTYQWIKNIKNNKGILQEKLHHFKEY